MSQARFVVPRSKFDSAGGEKSGTIVIDRDTGLATARPKHSRRVYELPLSSLAALICKYGIPKDLMKPEP